jgi:hypothetical protein
MTILLIILNRINIEESEWQNGLIEGGFLVPLHLQVKFCSNFTVQSHIFQLLSTKRDGWSQLRLSR